MRYCLALLSILTFLSGTALALDLPVRKAGLWELTMSFTDRKIPPQTMRQCIDAATDKLMNSNFGAATQQACSKQDMTRARATITVDSICNVAGATTSSHAVITGSFDSAYTMQVTSTRRGGQAVPGMASGGETKMTIEARWLGPCAAGERPGDMIMGNGMKINILDMRPPTGPRPARH